MTKKIEQHGTTITLTERNGKIQAVWYVDGKRQRKSTGTADIEQAERTARGFVTSGKPGSDITLLEALEQIWRETWSGQTTHVRRTYVEQAAKLWGNPRLADITRDMLMELRAWHRAQGTTETTCNRKLQPVITILNTAHHEWQVIPHPAPKVKRFKESKGRYRYLTDEEVSDMLEAADAPFDLIFRFAVETGARRGEILKLDWSMIDFQRKLLLLPGWVTKADETRAVPLDDDLLGMLKARMREQSEIEGNVSRMSIRRHRVFPEATVSTLRRAWAKVRARLGMIDDEDFVFHALRHTCATRLTNRGVPTRAIQMWLGHADIETTVRYLNQSAKDLDQYRHHAKCVSVSADESEDATGAVTH